MKHIILSLLLVLGISAQAQTRLSEMPWPQRDSIITAKVKKYFRDVQKRDYDDCVSIIRQKDNDRYNVSWVAEIYDKTVKKTGVWRAFVPTDSYLYDVKLFGKYDSTGRGVYNGLRATALVDENLEVLMVSMTDDTTVYSYKYEKDDRVPGVFDNPTRRPSKYKRPTEAELHTDEYAWGKSIASLSKDERIRVLTGIAFNALQTLDGSYKNEAVLYPVISEAPFKFIGYYWLPEDELDMRPSEVPMGMSTDDIYHCVEIYWEDYKKASYATPLVAKVYITDKDHRAFVIRRSAWKQSPVE